MSDAPTMDPATSVEGLLTLARTRAKAGDAEGAGRTFAAALHLAETHNLWGPTARAQAWLADIDVRRGRLPLARQRLDQARALCLAHPVAPDIRAEVAAQLGQVLLFQGHAGAGVALMAEAVGLFRDLNRTAERDELELAIAAVLSRVDQAVRDTPERSTDRVRALVRRAEVRLGVGNSAGARADLSTAWSGATSLSSAFRTRVGLDYSRLLIAAGTHHHAAALAVLQAVRPLASPDTHAEVDALVGRLNGAAEN
mgnify:CR=1 FL=1